MSTTKLYPDPANEGAYMLQTVNDAGIIIASVTPIPADARVQRQMDEPGEDISVQEAAEKNDGVISGELRQGG